MNGGPVGAKREYFPSLDGLRGFAALAVMFAHIDMMAGKATGRDEIISGQLAVDIFFVMSGFVMSHSYLGRPVKWAEFAKARFARIYPLHIATSAALVAMAFVGSLVFAIAPPAQYTSPQEAIEEVMLLSALPGFMPMVWNTPSWSISIEWWMYFTLFPFLAYFGRKANLVAAGFCLIALYAALGLWLDMIDAERMTRGWVAVARGTVGFSCGWLVWRAWRETMWKLSGAITDACAAVICLAWFIAPVLEISDGWPVFPLIVFFVFGLCRGEGRVAKALSCGPLVWLGEISYSIYLTHMVVLVPLQYVLRPLHLQGSLPVWFILGTGGTLTLSTISYHYLEKPARDVIRGTRWRRQALAA